MPHRDAPQSRKLEQLLSELAEIRAQADERRRRGAWWREEARAVREETRRVVAQARELVAASRRQWQERADAEDQ